MGLGDVRGVETGLLILQRSKLFFEAAVLGVELANVFRIASELAFKTIDTRHIIHRIAFVFAGRFA